MKIQKLQINGFGKLKNKEVRLNDGINIIYGENEAGKSTLLKFISAMFYGISKNKNGQKVPDKEKYTPWETEEYSGKISYTLDNGEAFEVYRDFKKTNPKILNHQLEDISKNFSIDKTRGNQFFNEQTGIDETVFTTSMLSKQGEVKLDDKSQNNLIQKISNLLGTGDDTNSYEKIVTKLKKKLNDEVGTAHTKEKPINIVESRIAEILQEKQKLEQYQATKFQMEEQQETVKSNLIEEKERIESLKMANIQLDALKSEAGKVEGLQQLLQKTDEEIQATEQLKPMQAPETRNFIFHKILIALLVVATVVCEIFVPMVAVKVALPVATLAWICYVAVVMSKLKKENQQYENVLKEYQNKLEVLQQNRRVQQQQIEQLTEEHKQQQQAICDKFQIHRVDLIHEEIGQVQSTINELTLKIHTMEIDAAQVTEKLEKFVSMEEELESLQEQREELEQKRKEIQKVLDTLAIAYAKMKEEVTPKFTNKLSSTISRISNQKYQKVRMNVRGEMMVEKENGDYVDAENLSIGTIDQLYLALRLATTEEITNEKMPIILDEAFAYYDTERMGNMLQYLATEYADRQIIIFTCSKREIELLEKLEIEHHLVHLAS